MTSDFHQIALVYVNGIWGSNRCQFVPSNCKKLSFFITEDLAESFPSEDYLPQVMSENFEKLERAVIMFSTSEAEKKPTFALWLNYIQMVEVLLMFLRATRENDWDLHLSAVRSMLPWFFSTGRVNYARYGTAYWLEMMCIETTHPGETMYLRLLSKVLLQ